MGDLLVLAVAVVGVLLVWWLIEKLRFEVRQCHGEGFAAWPWERCRGAWARAGVERRCDLLRGHDTDPTMSKLHYHEGGLDPIWWTEQEGTQ
jgi:hypothetical protein